tara:strand:- start:40 stop:1101 length:1062 start_codon:yes stop_codon:yes gene_type:complete
MAYTTIDDPTIYFNTVLYTGNGNTGHAITGVGFQPDWVWLKCRPQARNQRLIDSVRGVGKHLEADNTDAEESPSSGLTAFGSDGFTVGDTGGYNNSSENFVAWNWKAGTSFTNDASSTGIGSIDSSGSVSETAGFSICSFTGTGSVATIKHGLSTIPNVIITKSRANAENWGVLHSGINTDYQTDYLILNTNAGSGDSAEYYNDTAPTSSIFTVGTADATNDAANMISYIFSERKGYSKFGSYTGNGNVNGTTIWTGMRPALVIIKNTASSEHWRLYDNKRDPYNHMYHVIYGNDSGAESTTDNASEEIDFLANGFKMRSSAQQLNASGQVYIYLAFAEAPFVNSKGVPNNAR